jgi:hypothetical protein
MFVCMYLLTHHQAQYIRHDPLPSVNDILDIAENETKDNAIFIVQTEIDWLDDLSLEGDVPNKVSDM